MDKKPSPVSHASVWAFVVWPDGDIDYEAQGTHDYCLLRKGKANKCRKCRKPTLVGNLQDGLCPDCDGRGEVLGLNLA